MGLDFGFAKNRNQNFFKWPQRAIGVSDASKMGIQKVRIFLKITLKKYWTLKMHISNYRRGVPGGCISPPPALKIGDRTGYDPVCFCAFL